jgi:hypothetical protein
MNHGQYPLILLDFHSGSHGHFLEYVVNTYIFSGHRVDNLITDLGTCHNAVKNTDYQHTRRIRCGHYSEFGLATPKFSQVVTISVGGQFANICYQINVECRAGDIPQEKKKQTIPESIRNSAGQLRNNYYSKFLDPSLGYPAPNNLQQQWKSKNIPVFDVPMHALYSLTDFYSVLHNLANFLNHTFNPDPSLAQLWQNFILKNHGVQAYEKAKNLVKHALSNEFVVFEASIIEQALINYYLSQCIGMHDGPLFDSDKYPTTTQQIWQIIQNHIQTFDQRF